MFLKEKKIDLSLPLQEHANKIKGLSAMIQTRWIRLAPGGKKNLYSREDIMGILKELLVNPEFHDDEVAYY